MAEDRDDDTWFEAFFRARADRAVRLAFLLGSPQPEEVAQEAFVKVYAALPRLAADADVAAYLNRTVVNEVRSRHRRSTTHDRVRPLVVASARSDVTHPHEGLADALDVGAVLDALSRAQRQVVVLRYWADLPEREIATATGMPLGTVKSHLRRATARMRDLLEAPDGS